MEIADLKSGTRIKSKRWSEPVEVDKIEIVGDYVLIIGSSIYSDNHVKDLIPTDEVLNEFDLNPIVIDFSSNSEELFLAFETKRYKYASLYDPLLAVNISKVDPLPHQIEAVYGYILKLPRIRFLIADDPGAGKTIMAGLIIKKSEIFTETYEIDKDIVIPETKVKNKIALPLKIPKGKISDIMGLLYFIQSKFDDLEIEIKASNGSVTDEEYAKVIAIKQIK